LPITLAHVHIPTIFAEHCASDSASPTSAITPESVPPVNTHAFVACAALARPCLKALSSRGCSLKSCAPPVIEMSTEAGSIIQCFSIRSSTDLQ